MKIEPLNDLVLVEREKPESETKGGIAIPAMAHRQQTRGVVKAVGPGRVRDDGTRTPPEVKIGETIIMERGYAENVDPDNDCLVIIDASKIFAIVR